jgi:hypothetical protein
MVLPAAAVRACNVPVFRYALERFQSDPFEFVIYHRGPLGEEAKAAVDAMQKLASDSSSALQLQVRLVDLAAPAKPAAPPDPKAAPASKPPADAPPPSPQPPADAVLPWLMVVPPGDEQASPLWSGPFRAADLRALLDSPARRTLAERLLKGDSAVFVLLESGRRAADEAAEQLLRKTLANMEKSLQLPPQDDDAGNPDNQLRSKVPLRGRTRPKSGWSRCWTISSRSPARRRARSFFRCSGAAGSWRCCPASRSPATPCKRPAIFCVATAPA